MSNNMTQDIQAEIRVDLVKIDLPTLWILYKEFCLEASQTQDMKSDKATDFLGWLEKKRRD